MQLNAQTSVFGKRNVISRLVPPLFSAIQLHELKFFGAEVRFVPP